MWIPSTLVCNVDPKYIGLQCGSHVMGGGEEGAVEPLYKGHSE